MHVVNVHERSFRASAEQAAPLLDALGSPHDVPWPSKHWPGMRLDKPLAIRPLHDALVEDALTNAQVALGEQPMPVPWSPWVRMLRAVLGRRGRPRGAR